LVAAVAWHPLHCEVCSISCAAIKKTHAGRSLIICSSQAAKQQQRQVHSEGTVILPSASIGHSAASCYLNPPVAASQSHSQLKAYNSSIIPLRNPQSAICNLVTLRYRYYLSVYNWLRSATTRILPRCRRSSSSHHCFSSSFLYFLFWTTPLPSKQHGTAPSCASRLL
jgi:hypothetical protein